MSRTSDQLSTELKRLRGVVNAHDKGLRALMANDDSQDAHNAKKLVSEFSDTMHKVNKDMNDLTTRVLRQSQAVDVRSHCGQCWWTTLQLTLCVVPSLCW